MNLKMIAIAVGLISFTIADFARAENDGIDAREAAAIIKRVADQTDPQIVQSMIAGLEAAAREQTEGFKKMSDSEEPDATFLTCAMGDGAIMTKISGGICLSSKGRIYTLGGVGSGVSLGAKASLVMGFVKSKNSLIRGTYVAVGAGGASKALQYRNLVSKLKAYNVGLGGNIIIGATEKSDQDPEERTLVLAGPSLGAMIDLSVSAITLN